MSFTWKLLAYNSCFIPRNESQKLFFIIATIKQPNTSRCHIVYFFYSELKKFETAQPRGLMWCHKIPKELLSFFWLVDLTFRHFVLKSWPIKSLNRSDLFWATLAAYGRAWARPLQWPTKFGQNAEFDKSYLILKTSAIHGCWFKMAAVI